MVRTRASAGSAAIIAAFATLLACSQKPAEQPDTAAPIETTATEPEKPGPENTDTLDGTKLASFTGTADAGEIVFAACKVCHAVIAGKNMTGPSLYAVQGRASGTIAGYGYSEANKSSGIVWTNEKLYQYLESPQRVIPGTKMTYSGLTDPQKRADLIAYLDAQK